MVQHANNITWEKGVIVKKCNQPRSYLVKLKNNSKRMLRNSVHFHFFRN